MFRICCCLLGACLLVAGEARPLPPLPPSFRVDESDPQIDTRCFRGKVSLVVFCQDQDGKHNVLNYDLFNKLGQTFGGERRLILLAVRIDGGDPAGYLNARCDRSCWVAADMRRWTAELAALDEDEDLPTAPLYPTYRQLARLAETNEEQKRRHAAATWAAIAKRYPETRYGRLAVVEAECAARSTE